MRIDDYQAMVRRCAVYPSAMAFTYPVLGLCGESGEALDKIFTADGRVVQKAGTEVIKELGDVLWYVTAATLDLGGSIYSTACLVSGSTAIETFGDLEWWLLSTEDQRTPYMRLPIAAGELAEIAKKAIRDNGGLVNQDSKVRALAKLASILHSLSAIAKRLGTTLDAIAQANHDKLTSRKERGKLNGDGDNR